jgi:hypothetical protein
MTTEIATTKAFQDRMFERIRSQIGDLMTNEDLKKIVETAMQKAFFEPIRGPRQYGGDEVKDPALVAMVRDLLRERAEAVMRGYVTENAERIDALLRTELGKGFHQMIADYWDAKLQNAFCQFRNELANSGLLR